MAAIDNRIKRELDKLLKDGEMDGYREKSTRLACEAKILYDSFTQAGFNEAQSFELVMVSAGISWNTIPLEFEEEI